MTSLIVCSVSLFAEANAAAPVNETVSAEYSLPLVPRRATRSLALATTSTSKENV
ncbi:MAG: hypothetical protein AAF830_09425 [Pseudomonadota bacterium]